jgi:sporulation protein YlmC with PRC-barrel domain
MELSKGTGVYSAGEKIGEVTRVVIDPVSGEVTHVVIGSGWVFKDERIIDVEHLTDAEGTLSVAAGLDHEDFPPFEVEYTVQLDDATRSAYPGYANYPAYDAPLFWYGSTAGYPVGSLGWGPAYRNRVAENIPEDTTAVVPGTDIVGSDGESIGTLEEMDTAGAEDRLTGLVISQGFLGNTKRTIPASWVQSWGPDEIRLRVSSSMVAELPAS